MHNQTKHQWGGEDAGVENSTVYTAFRQKVAPFPKQWAWKQQPQLAELGVTGCASRWWNVCWDPDCHKFGDPKMVFFWPVGIRGSTAPDDSVFLLWGGLWGYGACSPTPAPCRKPGRWPSTCSSSLSALHTSIFRKLRLADRTRTGPAPTLY